MTYEWGRFALVISRCRMYKDTLRIVYELTEVQVTAQPGTGHRRERRKLKDIRRGQETLKMRLKVLLDQIAILPTPD